MHWLDAGCSSFSVLSRLHACKYKYAFYWMKYHWMWLLSDIVASEGFFPAWNPIGVFFKNRCCDSHFPGFAKYTFLQLQACTALVLFADCTDGSCSPNIVIFNNFLVFNFPFFDFKQYFLSPG